MVAGKLEAAGLSATLVQADFFRWRPDSPFDAIYEQTSLCALLPEQWRAYVRRLSEWLMPGGRLYALFMQTNRPGGPPFHCDLGAMKKMFTTDAWKWPASEPERVDHSTGFFELGVVLGRI
jgi:trans-aconitate methyltransferase